MKELSVFQGYSGKAMFLTWRYKSLSPNEVYLRLHYLKEICGLIQHHDYLILNNLRSIYKPHWRLYFEFKEFIPSAISSSGKICGLKLGIKEFLFVFLSSESFSLEYSVPSISLLLVWLCGS